MTFAVTRFTVGQPVEIRRQKGIGPDKRPIYEWESGYSFSHYDRKGYPNVRRESDGTYETLSHDRLRLQGGAS